LTLRMPSEQDTPHRITNWAGSVASGTRDHVFRRPGHPEIPIGPEEVEANSPKTVSFETEDAGSSAQQARIKRENLARNQARKSGRKEAQEALKWENEGHQAMWKVWGKALDQIQDQQRTIFALQERHVKCQEERIKELTGALKMKRGRKGRKRRKRTDQADNQAFTLSSQQPSSSMSWSATLPHHQKPSLMGSTGNTAVQPVVAPPATNMPFPYLMPMPVPGAAGAPYFRGKNITQFLAVLENLFEEFRVVSDVVKCKKLPWYCEAQIGRYVQAMEGYENKSWETLKTSLMREYEREDVDQQMQTRAFLEAYKSQKREEKHDLKGLCRYFTYISNALVAKGELDEYAQTMYFLEALPEKVRSRVLRVTKVDPKRPKTMKYEDVLQVVQDMALNAETEAIFKESSGRQASLQGLAKRMDISREDGGEYNFEPGSAGIENKPEAEMDKLAEGIRAMTLSINTAVKDLRTGRAPVTGESVVQQRVGLDPARESNVNQARAGAGGAVCYYCEVSGHIKPHCTLLNDQIAKNQVHVNNRGRLALGPRSEGAPEIVRQRGVPMAQSVADALAGRGSRAQPAEVRYLTVSTEDSDSEVEKRDPEEDEPQSVAEVFAARGTNNATGTGPRGRQAAGGVQDERARVTKNQARKEKEYPAMKALRNGVYEEATGPSDLRANPTVPGAPNAAADPELTQGTIREETLISNTPPPPLKHPKTSMSKLLKGVANPVALTERIMSTSIEIKLGELLANSKELQHVWFGRIPDPNYQPSTTTQVRSLGTRAVKNAQQLAEHLEGALYTAASPRVRASVEGKEMSCLLDSGAEVTVMSSRLALELALPISDDLVLNVAGVGGPLKRFVGVIEAVKIRVGSLIHEVPVWVMDRLDQDLILGRTYSRVARLALEDQEDGTCRGSVRSADGMTKVTFQAVSATATANRERNAFNRRHFHHDEYLNE
jgi:Aspartyl protease